MNETSRITTNNVYAFLRKFAKEISLDDLQPLPGHLRGGGSVTFYYRDSSILKVPKKGHRAALVKEARLTEHLNTQRLPVVVPAPLLVHDDGFYALFTRIDGRPLAEEALEQFASEELESVARALGQFLSFLHHHEFPDDVMVHIPRAEETFGAEFKRLSKRVQFVKNHAGEVDTTRWDERLERLADSLEQRWAVTHSDLSLNHLFTLQGKAERLAVIDFADAVTHDPAIDFSELAIELYSELPPDGFLTERILEMLLKHYQADDPAFADKIEFGLLAFEIRRVHQQVRNSVK